MNRIFTSLLLILCTSIAYASQQQADIEEDSICKMTGRSADDVNCSQKRSEAVEDQLNAQYKVFMKKLDKAMEREPDRLGQLKHNFILAQRAWVQYREKECQAVETWFTRGTLHKAYYYDCMKDMARTRISQFDTLSVQNK